MNAAPIPADLRAAAAQLARDFGAIVAALIATIARGFLRHPTRAVVIVPLCTWLKRNADRLARLATRLAAGRRPRPARPARRRRAAGTPPVALPRQHGWLLRDIGPLRHDVAACRSRLERLLDTEEAKSLLAAAPTAGRLLRPLCHMLALKPAVLFPPKPARETAAAPAPSPESPSGPRAPDPPPRFATVADLPCPRLAGRWPWTFLAAKPG